MKKLLPIEALPKLNKGGVMVNKNRYKRLRINKNEYLCPNCSNIYLNDEYCNYCGYLLCS